MLILTPIIEIFCEIDDFCNHFFSSLNTRLLPNPNRKRNRQSKMSISEIMTIMVLFHLSNYRTFKDFYFQCVQPELNVYFPRLVSYNRFVELQKIVALPLAAYLKHKAGEKTGLYFTSPLKVCHNRRIHKHKTFKGIATRGKHSMGWFFGFKLHIVINQKGEIMSFCLTKGNVDDRAQLEHLLKDLQGITVGDKGYISEKKRSKLKENGVELITKHRKNMKKKPLSTFKKFLLSKRGIIETVIEQLKAICQIEHTRHRSPINFIINCLSALAAYCLKPRKPSLKLNNIAANLVPLISN